MTSWTDGYVSDIEYTSGFYRELAPTNLNQALLLNGVRPPDIAKDFTYAELGCGQGLTTLLLAGAYPQGRFWGFDFNPAHIANAEGIRAAAGLDNLIFQERSFAELVEQAGDYPLFDYIVFHGIYSWITAENQKAMRDFVRSRLKPGGVVYVSYNCMPGWAAMAPMQWLVSQFAACYADRSDNRVSKAVELVEGLKTAGARFFPANPSVEPRMEKLKTANRQYLAHEYLNGNWQLFYAKDVADQMAEAKLTFVGAAAPTDNLPNLSFNADQLKVIEAAPSPELRETVKDFILNNQFRRDIFVRGPSRLVGPSHAEALLDQRFVLTVPRAEVSLKFKVPLGEVSGNEGVYNPIVDALAEGPRSMREILAGPACSGVKLPAAIQALTLLTGAGQIGPVAPERGQDGARRLNQELARRTEREDVHQALVSPVLGNAMVANAFERLVWLGLSEGLKADAKPLAARAWAAFKARGQTLIKEGKRLEGDEANLAEAETIIGNIVKSKLPVWKAIGIL